MRHGRQNSCLGSLTRFEPIKNYSRAPVVYMLPQHLIVKDTSWFFEKTSAATMLLTKWSETYCLNLAFLRPDTRCSATTSRRSSCEQSDRDWIGMWRTTTASAAAAAAVDGRATTTAAAAAGGADDDEGGGVGGGGRGRRRPPSLFGRGGTARGTTTTALVVRQRRARQDRGFRRFVDALNAEREANGERRIDPDTLRHLAHGRDFDGNDYDRLYSYVEENGPAVGSFLSAMGATDAEIGRCPTRTLSDDDVDLLRAGATCPVCLEGYGIGAVVRTIP